MNFLSEMFPVAQETFNDQASDAQSSATNVFLSGAVNIDKHKEFQAKLEGLFAEIVVKYNSKNEQASELKCKQVQLINFPELNPTNKKVTMNPSWYSRPIPEDRKNK